MSQTKKITLSRLNTFLKLQCDNLRAAGLDAAEYKDYIIAMIFLKRVNDQFDLARLERANHLREEFPELTDEELNDELEQINAEEYDFFVPLMARWRVSYNPTPEEIANTKRRNEIQQQLTQPGNSAEDIKKLTAELLSIPEVKPWTGISTVTENVGDALTISLNALEEANSSLLQGVLSTTKATFSWNFETGSAGNETDKAVMVVYNVDNGEINYSMGEVSRSAKTGSVLLPYSESGDKLLFYLFFQAADDAFNVSSSQLAGSTVVA